MLGIIYMEIFYAAKRFLVVLLLFFLYIHTHIVQFSPYFLYLIKSYIYYEYDYQTNIKGEIYEIMSGSVTV